MVPVSTNIKIDANVKQEAQRLILKWNQEIENERNSIDRSL